MPIVFVHGVSTRMNASYGVNEAARNGFLKEIVAPALGLDPDQLKIFSPYWGGNGATFAWNMASLPEAGDDFETFGAGSDEEERERITGLASEFRSQGKILEEARSDLPAAVDLLYGSSMAVVKTEEEARALARSYLEVDAYAQATPQPSWLPGATEGSFADELTHAANPGEEESFGAGGVLDSLKEGLSRLSNVAGDASSASLGRHLRQKLNAEVTRFAGDAFVYLAQRGTCQSPGEIIRIVLAALHEAKAHCSGADNKLIVMAHSFGGEIMYDILTHFDPALSVDCFITVGSQVGLFEEMKLYLASKPDLPPDPPQGRVPRPAAIRRWLNVFDTNDVLSYQLEPILDGVNDFLYDTGYGFVGAHGGYFSRPSFYRKLANRLKQG